MLRQEVGRFRVDFVKLQKIPDGAWVFMGGGSGALLRWILGLTLHGSAPLTTWGINVLGAFLLGALLTVLPLWGSDDGARRALRLLLGTGVLGGFTTYSSFMVQSVELARENFFGFALYCAGTLMCGALTCAAGAWLGGLLGAGRGAEREAVR